MVLLSQSASGVGTVARGLAAGAVWSRTPPRRVGSVTGERVRDGDGKDVRGEPALRSVRAGAACTSDPERGAKLRSSRLDVLIWLPSVSRGLVECGRRLGGGGSGK